MEFRVQRRLPLALVLLLLLLSLLHHTTASAEEETTPANSSEENDSSSEETVEDSNESTRRRRSADSLSLDGSMLAGDESAKNTARAGIPGLPDPATILKIAEILQTVGEKVIPVLLQGNPGSELVAERIGRDYQFLKSFKRELDTFTEGFKQK